MKSLLSSHTMACACLACFLCIVCVPTSDTVAKTGNKPSQDRQSLQSGNQKNEGQVRGLLKSQQAFQVKIQQTLSERTRLLKVEQAIQEHLTPASLMRGFVDEFRRSAKDGSFAETEKYLSQWRLDRTAQSLGGIKGGIKDRWLPGTPYVLAFDSHGYFAGSGKVERSYGLPYEIKNLPPGDYYVLTVTDNYSLVDVLYDDIPAPLFSREAWRNAKKVTVTAGTTTDNINFDLKSAAELLVTVFQSDGTTPVSDDDGTFIFTYYDRPDIVIKRDYFSGANEFALFMPIVGDFKLGVALEENQPPTWYKNSHDWSSAQKISITSLSDSIKHLGIIVDQQGSPGQFGKISGLVTGNGMFNMIYAFKASDLSLEQATLTFASSYTIEDLPPGEYYVYADDYLANIKPAGGQLGTFYKDAATIAEAQKVLVQAGQTTSSINITLRKGATIAGRVKDQNNNPVDSLLVVAFDLSFPEVTALSLFTQLSGGVGMTDKQGNYRIAGLASGNYIVRTLSDYLIVPYLGLPSIVKGPHKGLVVDEYYTGIQDFFELHRAKKVSVRDTLTSGNIDFVLQKAKFFRGKLYEATTKEPIHEALLVAYRDSTGYPYYAVPVVDDSGAYTLGPFPSGKYRMMATAYHQEKDFYLPEFYDNAKTYNEARVLELTDSDLAGINFGFDRGAVIQGHIDLAEGSLFEPAGADTLFNFPVALFNVADGSLARYAYVQFDGGFRLPRLSPGRYKLVALPMDSPFGATYFGGGNYFDDPASQVIEVSAGQVLDENIEMKKAGGMIRGAVSNKQTGEPVSNCLVIAYDATGHAIGLGLTDASLKTLADRPATGRYQITGLRPQQYYLCTYAFTDEAGIAAQVPGYLMSSGEPDLFGMLFSLLEALFATDMTLYSDSWYDQVTLPTSFEIKDLVISFMIYGTANERDCAPYPLYMPIPFYRHIPQTATSIAVALNGSVENVNFQLAAEGMGTIFTDVQGRTNLSGIKEYALFQNYPNPFNPSTTIRYDLPYSSHVTLAVFNTLGQEVSVLVNDRDEAGIHEVKFDGSGLPSGVYFYRLYAGTYVDTKRLLLLK